MITKSQTTRFKGSVKCPVCTGCEDDDRGQGSRCFGYRNGAFIYCTREDHAGKCEFVPGATAYRHRSTGECPCGVVHAPADPPPNRKCGAKLGEVDKVYPYIDLEGKLRFETVRFKNPKDFRQRQPGANGKPVWNLKGVKTILYRLPELSKADPAQQVYLTEGEKDADRLRALGEVATCNPMGALKWQEHYAESLRGANASSCRITTTQDASTFKAWQRRFTGWRHQLRS